MIPESHISAHFLYLYYLTPDLDHQLISSEPINWTVSDKRDTQNVQFCGSKDLFTGLQSHYLKDDFKRGFVTLAGQYLINAVTLSIKCWRTVSKSMRYFFSPLDGAADDSVRTSSSSHVYLHMILSADVMINNDGISSLNPQNIYFVHSHIVQEAGRYWD